MTTTTITDDKQRPGNPRDQSTTPSQPPLALALPPPPLDNIPQKLQPTPRKLHHIPLPIPPPRLQLPRHLALPRARNRKSNIPRLPPPPLPTSRRPRGPALAKSVRTPERLAHVPREPGDDGRGGARVARYVGLGPAGVGEAGGEGVELWGFR